MPSIRDRFWHEFRGAFDRLPVWLPGTHMALGDVGAFDKRGWTRMTSLQSLNIDFATDSDSARVTYSYSSPGGVEITTKLSADPGAALAGIADGNAGLRISFSRAAAFVLIADSARVHRIADLADVDQRVLQAYSDNVWQPDWTFISEIVVGQPSLLAVAADSSAEATVDLGATLQAGSTILGRADSEFSFGHKRHIEGGFATSAPSTIMWRGRYVRDPRFGRTRARERGPESGPIRDPEDPGTAQICDVKYPSDITSGNE
jgi:hypothetical protein